MGRWEKRIVDRKTRTLEHHKGAAPKIQKQHPGLKSLRGSLSLRSVALALRRAVA
jgi:hypothetical protein